MKADIALEQRKIKKIGELLGLSDISNIGFWEMNSEYNMVLVNKLFYKDYGVDFENIPFESWTNLIHPNDRISYLAEVNVEAASQSNTLKTTYRVLKKDNQYAWIESLSVADYDEQGKLIGMIGAHTDITEYKQYKSMIEKLGDHDSLTGLYNESKLIEISKKIINQNTKCYVMFIFMYNFFLLQDTFGIEYTTKALVKFGQILTRKFPTESDVFKLRAQEFVVICYGDTSRDELIGFFNQAAEETGVEIYKNIKTFQPYIHTGICELPQEGVSHKSLINKTRLTLRYAKTFKSGTHTFYNSKIENYIRRELYIRTNLLHALEEDELYLKYQPIINSTTQTVDSYEALLRWGDKIQGEIYPDEFIPIAERTGDIVDIGYFVLRESCDFITRFETTFGYCPTIAVNVSVVQLLNNDFANKLLQILKSKKIDPKFITIEITESITLNKENAVMTQLNFLQQEGLGISLDDFGIGYSSLKTLIDVPLTQLKIDREIVENLLKNESMKGFIKSLIIMCHDNNIKVVAEGIEEEKDIKQIIKMDFDLIQGYYYAMPENEETILKGTNKYPSS